MILFLDRLLDVVCTYYCVARVTCLVLINIDNHHITSTTKAFGFNHQTTNNMIHLYGWVSDVPMLVAVSMASSWSMYLFQCMDNTFLYGFEYLGSAKREPITPWTERVFLSLTLAIKSYKAGLCMGTPVSIVNKIYHRQWSNIHI